MHQLSGDQATPGARFWLSCRGGEVCRVRVWVRGTYFFEIRGTFSPQFCQPGQKQAVFRAAKNGCTGQRLERTITRQMSPTLNRL